MRLLKAPRPTVSGWAVEVLDQGEEPRASRDGTGDGAQHFVVKLIVAG